jgi:lipoyl-dependent peroxiredoxin
MPKRTASARWDGTLQEGSGTMRMKSGSYEGPYSFQSRFQEADGTNPEELIAAAHAGCFSMALCSTLSGAGHTPRSIETKARVHLRLVEGMPTIQQIDLETKGDVPDLDADGFRELAERAKAACAVSRALRGVEQITVSATLAASPSAA